MIKIYTVSSCTSCKKAKNWLNAHRLSYNEHNLAKEEITKQEILDILTKTENGIASIVSSKNRYAKSLDCDIEEFLLIPCNQAIYFIYSQLVGWFPPSTNLP